MRASSWLNQISLFIFCLFPLLIALPPKGMLAVVFIVLQFLVSVINWRSWSFKGIWFPVLQTLPTAFFAISLFYSDDMFYGGKYFETTMFVAGLPWILFLNKASLTPLVQKRTLRFYSLVVIAFVLYLIISFISSGTLISSLNAPDAYFQIRTQLEVITGMHPTYFSLLLAIALLVIQSEIKKGNHKLQYYFLAFIGLSIIVVGLLLASSKMILAATFVGSVIIWGEKWKIKTILLRGTMAASILLVVVLLIKPMRQRVFEFSKALAQTELDASNPDSMRKVIFKATKAVISENIWLGTGIGDQQHALDQKYAEFGFKLAEKRHFNTHNQYLQVWLAAGLVPFLFFLLLIIIQIAIGAVNKNYLHLSIATLFALALLTENILSRQDGVFIYAFFSSFLVFTTWSGSRHFKFINGRFKTQNATGVQRFSEEISRHLLEKSKDYLLITPKYSSEKEQFKSLNFFSGNLWEQLSLPCYLRLLGSPKLINLGNSAPIMYYNQAVTLHDVAFKENPNWFSRDFVRWYNFMIPKILRHSKNVFTVSEFSKTEIVKHFKIKKDKITVLYNGFPDFVNSEKEEDPIISEDYVLSVGSLSARKNQKQIIDCFLAWPESPLKLVIAGSFDKGIFGEHEELRLKIQQSNKIELVQNPKDDVLANLYKHAKFTIYLPLYEGFGLPVAESLAFGKPVIVSDIPVFRELYAGHALFYSLNNNGNLRGKIEELLSTLDFWLQKAAEAKELASKYSYKKSAFLLDKVIREQQGEAQNK